MENVNTLSGHWIVAIVMIVLVGWFLFRYLVPQSWKEWRAAGIVQAFVIALYAEMYGFPLTIYLLTTWLGLDIPWLHVRGHLWSTLLGLGATGAMVEMIVGYAIIALGVYLIAAGWRLVYQARNSGQLVTGGLYAYMRHPQYTGLFLAIVGQLVHWPTLPGLVLAPGIFWLYFHLARKEERALIQTFGAEYEEYRRRTPMFWPGIRTMRTGFGGVSR